MSDLILLNKKIDEILEKNSYLEKKVEQLTKTVDQHEFKIQELLLLLRIKNNSNSIGGSNQSSPRSSTEIINPSSLTTTPTTTINNVVVVEQPNSIINSTNSFVPISSASTSSSSSSSSNITTTNTTNNTVNNNNNTINDTNNNKNNVNNNNQQQTNTQPISSLSSSSTISSTSSSPIISPVSSPQISGRPRIQFLGSTRAQSTGNLLNLKKEDSSESLLKYSKDGEHIYIAPTTPRPSKSPSMDFISSSSLVNSITTDNNESNSSNNNSLIQITEEILPELPDKKCQWAIIWGYSAEDDEWTKAIIAVEIESKPFSKGSLRNAYQLKIRTNPMHAYNHFSTPIHEKYLEGKTFNQKELPKLNANCLDTLYVAKDSKTSVNYSRYFEDVKMQMICKSYATRYNDNHPPKKIEFLSAWVIEIQGSLASNKSRYSSNNTLYGLELFMKGEFKKQNTNFGSILSDRNTPQAFSHFTYECTAHEMLVVDIQGVDDIYTDPQIHSKDGKGFGEGNLGQRGIERFINSHKCNPICLQFGLPTIGMESSKNMHRIIRGTMLAPDLGDLSQYEPEYPKLEAIPSDPLNSELVCIGTLSSHSERVCSLLFNQDKTILFSASADGWVKYWSISSAATTTATAGDQQALPTLIDSFRAHRQSVEKMLLSDKYLFTASSDGTIKVWSLPKSISPNGNSSSFECLFKLDEHTAEVNDICIDCENNFLVSCSFDKTIKLWDLESMKCIKSINAHGKSIKSIYMSGKYLISSSNDLSIKVWDLEMMMCIYGMSDAHNNSITILRIFGNRLISASKDGEIKEWNLSTYLPTTTLDQNTSAITDILVTANGYLFIASDDSTIKILDLNCNQNGEINDGINNNNNNPTMKIINSIKGHRSGVNSLTTNGHYIFSGGCDNAIKIWNWKDK